MIADSALRLADFLAREGKRARFSYKLTKIF